jgi:hypothetical protein
MRYLLKVSEMKAERKGSWIVSYAASMMHFSEMFLDSEKNSNSKL